MSSKVDLKLDWATHKAAKYACENWHYSKCLPVGKLVKIGVWEDKKYIGCVIYSRGANKSIGAPYGCSQTDSCELTRIALNNHKTQVSRILAISIKYLQKNSEGIKLIVSFADKEQNHHGGIYQATNWIYTGETSPADEYLYKGKRWHGRAFRKSKGSHLNYINKGLKIVSGSKKHRYIMPLNSDIKRNVEQFSKPYPKRVKQASVSDQENSGGAAPTDTLQENELCQKV